MKGLNNAKQVGGSKLYLHNIDLSNSAMFTCKVQIISSDSTPFTKATMCSYLNSKGFTTISTTYRVTGIFYDLLGTSKQYPALGIYSDGTEFYVRYTENNSAPGNDYYIFNNDQVIGIN